MGVHTVTTTTCDKCQKVITGRAANLNIRPIPGIALPFTNSIACSNTCLNQMFAANAAVTPASGT